MEVDVAVIEVGMGWTIRCDQCACQPLASVAITECALDHEAYLGHTVSAIAFEKADG